MTALSHPRKFESFFWPVLTGVLCLALWHFAVRWSGTVGGTTILPSPIEVEKGLRELATKGLLWNDIGDSLRRVGEGFSLAVILGVPAGLALGWYPTAAQVVNPVVEMVRPISPIAWIPVSIVWFGVGDSAAVFLVFLGSFLPILVASMNGVRNVPSMFRRAGRNFGLSPVQLLTRVIFPASLPEILIGVRIALGIAWLVVVAAEMVAVDSGLGYLVIDSRNSGKRYDLVVAAMLMIGLIGLALDMGCRRLEKVKAVRWGFRVDA